ncbi:MAG: N-acetylglucosamine-6-phosphate deacetylase [Planctomycetes bacterium]|nr:N-acetylglucosamine-6-phosphate deacetylase [Planctomycetota bacterium]
MSLVLRSRRIVVGDRLLDGAVTLDGDRIVEVGPAPARGTQAEDLGDATLAPGFIDLQCNGSLGISVENADAARLDTLLGYLASTGVTSLLLAAVSYPLERLEALLARLPSPADGLLGLHLEGPFLDPDHAGAHDPAALRPATPEAMARLLAAGRGAVRMVTLAPERDPGLACTRRLAEGGMVVSLGHSGADAGLAHAAFDGGARAVTHLFNAMGPFHHRDPGLVGAALVRDEIYCGVIADGHHLSREALALAYRQKGPERLFLVTDAVPAAGLPEGDYPLGPVPVSVRGGEVRTSEGRLAGSTLTMDRAASILAGATRASVPAVVRTAATTPAALLGLSDRGVIAAGHRADLVALGEGYRVLATWRGGREVYRCHPGTTSCRAGT